MQAERSSISKQAWDEEAAAAMVQAFLHGIAHSLLFMRRLRAVRVFRWAPDAAAPTAVAQVCRTATCLCCLEHAAVLRGFWNDGDEAGEVCICGATHKGRPAASK